MSGATCKSQRPNIEYNVCYEKAVVEMNKHVGDDNVGVEKSPKKNEK